MTARAHHHQLIEWLDGTSHWLAHRAAAIGDTRSSMAKSLDQMTFRAPAGDRVRRSGALMEKNFVSIEHELRFMAKVCERESNRLRAVDHRVDELYRRLEAHSPLAGATAGLVVSPVRQQLLVEVARYEHDPVAWADQQVTPEPIDEIPLVTPVDPDEPATTELTQLEWISVDGRTRCRPPQPPATTPPGSGRPPVSQLYPWPPTVTLRPGTAPATGAVVMDLDSIRATSQLLARCSAASYDHQAVLTRRLSTLPPELRPRLRRRLERTRRACSLGLERAARRLSRQASLLRTRAATPGLVDGAFTADLPPFGQLPKEWAPRPETKEYRVPLIEQTERYVRTVTQLNRRMTFLVRRLPVINGALPPGWWKPVGTTRSQPPKPVWGRNIPPHLLAVVALLADPTAKPKPTPKPSLPPVTPPSVVPPPVVPPSPPGKPSIEVEPPEDNPREPDPNEPDPNDPNPDDPADPNEPNDPNDPNPSDPDEPGDDDPGPTAERPTAPRLRSGGSVASSAGGHVVSSDDPVLADPSPTATVADDLPPASSDDARDAVAYRRPVDAPAPTTNDSSLGAAPIAAGGAVVSAGAAGGLMVANKKARSRIVDWAGYVQRHGVLARKDGTP